jgi:adenosylhomocysteine nucleosidase
VDTALGVAESADALSAKGSPLTLVCALAVEERAAAKGGARARLVGLGAQGHLPSGLLVSYGLAGALVSGLEPGTLLTARRVVDAEGTVLWEDEPLRVPGALTAVVCDAGRVVDDPEERRELARSTGAAAVDTESATLAATGRLAGVVRAISDTPEQPVGKLAHAATQDGGTDWRVVAQALTSEPRATLRTALATRRALASLRSAASALAPEGAR